VPYVVGLCSKGTPQASQTGSCSMPRPIKERLQTGILDITLGSCGVPQWAKNRLVSLSCVVLLGE
jgi:hypothetical protein